MSKWEGIDSAPRDGSVFLAYQDGEIYAARYSADPTPRLCFRTHSLRVMSRYLVKTVEIDGGNVEAHIPVGKPWPEVFEHHWCFWTRGFEFAPTHWHPKPEPPKC